MPAPPSWSGHYTLDPSEMENRFATEDGLAYMDSIFTEPTSQDRARIELVKQAMDSLPPREADFVELYYFRRLRQSDIAAIFSVSQPTVCYRLARAAARIRFLLHLPEIDREKMQKELTGFLSDPLDVRILLLMWETTCQSEAAKRLGVSQGLVRHRFLRAVAQMRANRRFRRYVKLFDYIAANLNILREVQRPNGDDCIRFCVQ